MKVSIRFKNENHEISLPQNAKLYSLTDELTRRFNIPVENQKIIWKGKPMTVPMEPLVDGMKLMLIVVDNQVLQKEKNPFLALFGHSSKTVKQPNRPRPVASTAAPKNVIRDTLRETSHALITNKGLPTGFTPTSTKIQEMMPEKPLFIRNSKGNRATFSFDDHAIVSVDDNGAVEKIPIPLISDAVALPIKTHPGYFALGVKIDATAKWFYFIPSQYQTLIMVLLRQ